jgi:glycosyltransferase involved in cell wall biosynthesis
MHIGLDGLPLTSPKTGVGHYSLELARALAESRPTDHFELLYPSTYPRLNGNESLPNLKLERVEVGPLGRHWWSVGLPRHIRQKKLQLFHGTNYEVPLWRQCATVVTIHDLSLLLHPATHPWRAVARARRRLPTMVRTADAIITPTETIRREVCEHLKAPGDKVFAIPEAARASFRPMQLDETEEVRHKLRVGNEFLLAVGTIEPRKNLSLLISAFDKVTRAQPENNLQLVIAGGAGWLSNSIFEAMEKSTARDRIVLTDYLEDDELRVLYSSCRAFVYPSIYEGFGLPPLEAMACGAPVIASDIAALNETLGEATVFFDPSRADDLAQKILRLVNDESMLRTLSAAGRRRASEFSWEQTAQLTLAVYDGALKRRMKSRE